MVRNAVFWGVLRASALSWWKILIFMQRSFVNLRPSRPVTGRIRDLMRPCGANQSAEPVHRGRFPEPD
jgi:hypothetical protein